jgi:hypothetical protein
VVASIDNEALTSRDLETEARFERFLDGESPETTPDTAELERIRERLIEQRILADEAPAESPEATGENARALLDEVRKGFGSEEAYQAARSALRMDEQEILARISSRQNLLRFIEQQLRPVASPDQAELETAYRQMFLSAGAERSPSPPPQLAEVEGKIRELLVERTIDQLLASRLDELKLARRVKLYPLESSPGEFRSKAQ